MHLAKAGTSVVVLEGKMIGFGGAGRNVGLINAGLWVMPDEVLRQLPPDYGERLIDLLGKGPRDVMEIIERHDIYCELEKQGTLHCAVGEAGLKEIEQRAAQWRRRGVPVEQLDTAQTASRVGGGSYAGALHDPRAGTLQPLAYARGLARVAIVAGAKIYTASPVVSTMRDGRFWVVTTPGGQVCAEWVIVATDAYSTDRFRDVREEQVHLPYFNLATVPLSDNLRRLILPNREGAWDTRQILSSFRMDREGRLIFGSVGALRNTGAMIHRAWAKRQLAKLFPQLGRIEFDNEWYGNIGMTDDALPRFHAFAPNVVGFSGYNGRGIAPGTVFGRTLAQLALGKIATRDLPLPVTPLKKASLRFAKEAFYELGAQLAHFPGAVVP
jgi:glycine/D-amino acid oxidase-like deaminating enzyme